MRLFPLFFLLICFDIQAAVTATVNTAKIKYGQNVLLNISSDNAATKTPNLTILKRSFKVIGNSKVSRPYLKNGVRKQKTQWFFILKPKTSGTLTIPAIKVNGEKTKAITVKVISTRKKSTNKSQHKAKKTATHDILVKATINKNKLFPNEMLTYQLTINFPNIANSDFKVTAPFIPGAIVLPLAEPTFKQVTQRSKARTVRSQSYAIFAEQLAFYQIEPASISFNDAKQGDTENMVTLKANSLHFEIKPKANQTSLGYWLPSDNIQLSQTWEGLDPTQQAVPFGSSVKRIIELKANALNADILPLLSDLIHQRVQLKLEDVSVSNELENGILIATRREVVSMVFNQAGNISIPPVDLHWWNTKLDQARIASLDALNFTVLTVPVNSQMSSSPEKEIAKPINIVDQKADETKKETNKSQANPLKQSKTLLSEQQMNWLILLLFTLLVATTAGWLISSRKAK
ncbi:MAG: BatD family protein [Oceanospirillaceae bacterium]